LHSYSKRLPWPFSSNCFSRLIEIKREAGADLLDLTVSNPTEVFADYPSPEIARAYSTIDDFSYRPNPFGDEQSRLILARQYYERRGISTSHEKIVLTASTSEAYSVLFKLLCDPGHEILVPVPSYPLFEYLASLESVSIARYRILYDGGWFIDLDSLEEQITPRTRAIVVINPHNPTGSFLKQSEKEHHRPLTIAEVYSDRIVVVLPPAAVLLLVFFRPLRIHPVVNFALGAVCVVLALRLLDLETALHENIAPVLEMCLREPFPVAGQLPVKTDGAVTNARMIEELINA